MLEVKAKPFVLATNLITQMVIYGKDPELKAFAPETMDHIREIVVDLRSQCLALGLSRPTLASLDGILGMVEKAYPPMAVHHAMKHAQQCLAADLGGEFLLSLSVDEKRMYEADALWGDRVSLQFPSLQDEIREAGKCLALARYTASAFHSLRCLESAIVAMSRCLCIADPTRGHERNWGVMLGKIDKERKARWNAAARMGGDGQIFDDLYGALAGMQNPWRNATMHLEHAFNEEQAKHVFEVVGGFMRRVADRMDENGFPLA